VGIGMAASNGRLGCAVSSSANNRAHNLMDAGGRRNGGNNLCSGYLTIKRGKTLQKQVGNVTNSLSTGVPGVL